MREASFYLFPKTRVVLTPINILKTLTGTKYGGLSEIRTRDHSVIELVDETGFEPATSPL